MDAIFNKQIEKAVQSIEQNEQINLMLTGIGRIHIDKNLPFILFYQLNHDYRDDAVEKLIRSEASYCMVENSETSKEKLKKILVPIIQLLASEFGSFLICEILLEDDIIYEDGNPVKAQFILSQSKGRNPDNVIDLLQKELSKYSFNKIITNITKEEKPGRFLQNIEEFITKKVLNKNNCFSISISLNPFFINPETKTPYPLVLRRFHRFFSRSFRRAIFEFTKNHCSKRPKNYQSLGKRSFVKKIWGIDEAISRINSNFDLLFLVTPYNVDEAWRIFRKSKYSENPVFRYRPVPVEPSTLKRQLFKINLNDIEDPVLYRIFSEKQIELDRQISLIQDRGSKKFLFGSMQLYGDISEDLFNVASELLSRNPDTVKDTKKEAYLNAKEIQTRSLKEIEKYRTIYNDVRSTVTIDDDISGILVSNGNLYIGSKTKIRKSRIKSVLNHEVGTHIVTFYNGQFQPFKLLQSGFAGYEELQEGLAVFSEYLSGGLTVNRMRLLAARVIAAKSMIDGADFIETFNYLTKELHFSENLSFIITMRVFRGGGYIKDAIYLKGFIKLLNYLSNQKKWEHLFYGKISFEHLPLIIELESRKILKPIPVIPDYMRKFKKEECFNANYGIDDLSRILYLIEKIN